LAIDLSRFSTAYVQESLVRRLRAIALVVTALIPAIIFISGSLAAKTGSATGANHIMLAPSQIKWRPFPALGPGIQVAILTGDPFKTGSLFVFRLEMPDGARVPPHWHPVDEHVTVISGTFLLGAGERFDTSALRELPAGSYAFMPKHARHFALAKGNTIIQLNGVGAFKVIYVNPADDPSRKTALPSNQGS
jgi:quercetin dioxygenase-like cupin family protein